MDRPRVVIVGAGFGGLQCARRLAGKQVDVTLIDRNNFHLFTPLLYQVASSLLNPSDIAEPVRSILRGNGNVRFLLAEVTGIDLDHRLVHTRDGGTVAYDYLVLAAGSTTNYFGIDSVTRQSYGLKNLPEALELRNHILRTLERAAEAPQGPERERLLSFVVVGGGPTGVEYAGALSELIRLVIPREYPELAGDRIKITLVEGLSQLLAAFPKELGVEAAAELERRGIRVLPDHRVKGATATSVELEDGSTIETETIVWAAGVRPSALAKAMNVPTSKSGRLVVDRYLRLQGRDREFAIGDIASFSQQGEEVPMLSAPAMQEGRTVATNILRALEGRHPEPFRFNDRGSMATIGRNSAVASIGRLRLKGFVGWVTWLLVHLYYIIGFRNRLAVLSGWAWNYLRYDRPVRIITRARSGMRPADESELDEGSGEAAS